ncbi:hypothetical protein, partial [Parabacteroides sp. ZJ-118]|uniref:hypothetical protein n=1 Tax=Parabacteroides sp. ZJ-118 TaxID=2709398 RepID=UPI00197CF6A0
IFFRAFASARGLGLDFLTPFLGFGVNLAGCLLKRLGCIQPGLLFKLREHSSRGSCYMCEKEK